jgi:hypothetical protein
MLRRFARQDVKRVADDRHCADDAVDITFATMRDDGRGAPS